MEAELCKNTSTSRYMKGERLADVIEEVVQAAPHNDVSDYVRQQNQTHLINYIALEEPSLAQPNLACKDHTSRQQRCKNYHQISISPESTAPIWPYRVDFPLHVLCQDSPTGRFDNLDPGAGIWGGYCRAQKHKPSSHQAIKPSGPKSRCLDPRPT